MACGKRLPASASATGRIFNYSKSPCVNLQLVITLR
jgi:hypothetical protein